MSLTHSTPQGCEFKEERFTDVVDDLMNICIEGFIEHNFLNIPFSPDLNRYKNLSDAGLIKTYTMRDQSSQILGFSIFSLYTHSYSSVTRYAVQDIIYVTPSKRGPSAVKFITWIDKQLQLLGANVVLYSVNKDKDFGRLLEKIGCSLTSYVYTKVNL
jgi:DNA-binding Lrp family transcriptional regulator